MAEHRVDGYRRVGEEEKLAAIGVIGLAFDNPEQARDWAARSDAEQMRVLELLRRAFASPPPFTAELY